MLRPLIALLLLVVAVSAQSLPASWETLTLRDGGVLTYKLGLPDDFSPLKSHPALLALPPGSQTREMVDASWPRYWAEQASSRSWIVVSPVAPDGHTFFDGSEQQLPELMDHLLQRLPIELDRFHLAGVSNGGRSAFRVATLWPERFLSLTVLPGYPAEAQDVSRLQQLVDLPVSLYVGGDDAYWLGKTHETADMLRAVGVSVTTTVVPGEGHTPPSLDGDVILERLEQLRAAPGSTTGAATGTTTVFVVRHAEKRGQDDVLSAAGEARAEALARMLEPTALDAIYATEYARTQATVAPTAAARNLRPQILPAREDTAGHLLREHRGESVLVAGHSNTVPAILRGLGVNERIVIPESRYGDLFVVTITDAVAHLVRLRY